MGTRNEDEDGGGGHIPAPMGTHCHPYITTLCSTPCTSPALTTSIYISLLVEIFLSLSFTHYLTQLHHI